MFAVSLVTIQTGIFNGFTRPPKLIDNFSRYLGSLREPCACGTDAANPVYKPPGATGGRRGAGSANCQRSRVASLLGEITPVSNRICSKRQLFIPKNITQGSLRTLSLTP